MLNFILELIYFLIASLSTFYLIEAGVLECKEKSRKSWFGVVGF